MIERIILGFMVGVISESFELHGEGYQKAMILVISIVFILDSGAFGMLYGLMAMIEIISGFVFSGWFRVFKLT